MSLSWIDWAVVASVLTITLVIGFSYARRAGRSGDEFFLSGRKMGWKLLGLSMVATTFSTDTPGLVTQFVREKGVAGNWLWWCFLLTGMLTTFLFARLWRRSGVATDMEFYELRYSGRPASFLRGFRAIYLGVVFNVVVMAIVSLAAIKIGQVLLGLSPMTTLISASLATALFSTVGGFSAVVVTDCVLFFLAMTGSIGAAYFAVNHPAVGGLSKLVAHPAVSGKLAMLPELRFDSVDSRDVVVTLLVIPLAVQWWSVWYPGAEPGGGGYLAQRMLAAKDERNAIGAIMLFNVAHYALRPWPWILVALASLIVFPEISDLEAAFPGVAEGRIKGDLAYPAMLTFLPIGWKGIVVASLMAAYMSTISTQLNWGSSYLVNDVYQRFIDPNASPRRQVAVGRISTLLLIIMACVLALYLQSAKQGFGLLLQIGAGTGLIFILRWFWWRVNAASEITAMMFSFGAACYFQLVNPSHGLPDWQVLLIGIAITTLGWLGAIYLFGPEPTATLESFCRLVRPGGPGWSPIYDAAEKAGRPIPRAPKNERIGIGLWRMACATAAVYAALFAIGFGLYGDFVWCATNTICAAVFGAGLALSYRETATSGNG